MVFYRFKFDAVVWTPPPLELERELWTHFLAESIYLIPELGLVARCRFPGPSLDSTGPFGNHSPFSFPRPYFVREIKGRVVPRFAPKTDEWCPMS